MKELIKRGLNREGGQNKAVQNKAVTVILYKVHQFNSASITIIIIIIIVTLSNVGNLHSYTYIRKLVQANKLITITINYMRF